MVLELLPRLRAGCRPLLRELRLLLVLLPRLRSGRRPLSHELRGLLLVLVRLLLLRSGGQPLLRELRRRLELLLLRLHLLRLFMCATSKMVCSSGFVAPK